MGIEIDYAYSVDGLFHSINYYRSESPLDINNMPSPAATGITELNYTDTEAESGKIYYVRFGSVKADIEKISDQITVSTGGIIEYADTYLNLFADVVDRGLKPKVFTGSDISFSANFAVFNGSSSSITSPASSDFGFGTNDFTIELAIKSTGAASRCLIDFRDASNGNVSLWYAPNGVYWLDDLTFEKTSDVVMNDGSVHHIAVVRRLNNLKIYIDGIQSFSKTTTKNYGASRPVSIGKTFNNASYFSGSIRKVRITKGVAVYLTNFTSTYQI